MKSFFLDARISNQTRNVNKYFTQKQKDNTYLYNRGGFILVVFPNLIERNT